MASIWLGLIIALLIFEFINMELWGASGAIGALGGLVASFLSLHPAIQIAIAIVITLLLIVGVRPIGMKYVLRMKKEKNNMKLIGKDAVVINTIDNSQGLGAVSVGGKQWPAKGHRANAVIRAGSVVKVVAVNGHVLTVDDGKRNVHGTDSYNS